MKLEPLIEMPNMVTGVWRRFGVHVFEGKLTLEDMVRMDDAGVAWHKKNQGKTVELVIVFPSNSTMTADERKRMARIIKRWEHLRIASATAILATGLVGAAQRSVLTGLQLIAPVPHPYKVFGAIEPAVEWLNPHVRELLGPEATLQATQLAVAELCTTFKASR